MGRQVERTEGLAVLGSAPVGPLHFPTPTLLESRTPGEDGAGPGVVPLPAPSGRRGYRLTDGTGSIAIEVPILAPEVAAGGSTVADGGAGVRLWHGPAAPAEVAAARTERPSLIVLANARSLWADGEAFVRAVRQLRGDVGAGPLVWTPRLALPHRVPLLAYLGVDLVDSVAGRIEAARGTHLDTTLGAVDGTAYRSERPCDCPYCADAGVPDDHVRAEYRRSIAETRAALRAGRLRELVEARLPAEPVLAEMLRYADRELGPLLDQRTPVVAGPVRPYVIAESHRRPEMVRFRRRLLERYRPPPSKAVLLLVPCSRTKPYRTSRSHRRFAAALDGVPHLERVHVVSVSSPIGVVPRELEDVPPARSYDIPVTGEWTETEQAMVRAGVDHLVRSGAYRSAVVHLDIEEYGFLRDRFPSELSAAWTVAGGRSAAPEALDALRSAVAAAVDGLPAIAGGPLAVVREEWREVAAVQFGRPAADRLFASPVRLAGRPWFQRITDGATDLATVREERGLFHLTVAGARRLGPTYPLAVEVDPALPLTGDLFVPGVRAADPEIRPGDSVVLLQDGALAAVGEAALPGPMMTELTRGLAVRVRHRAARPTDTPISEEPSRPERGPVV